LYFIGLWSASSIRALADAFHCLENNKLFASEESGQNYAKYCILDILIILLLTSLTVLAITIKSRLR
jgi:hypothetical protein